VRRLAAIAFGALTACSATHPTVTWDGLDPASPADFGPADAIVDVPVRQRPWHFTIYEGIELQTPHYRIYTTLTSDPVLDTLPLFMERALARYTTSIARLPAPGSRLETFLFETRGQWEAKTRLLLPEQASIFLALGRGGVTTRGTSLLYFIGRADTLAIAAHEGWHQYSQRTFRSPLPMWMEEGIATWMEGYVTYPDGVPKFRPWANRQRYHTLREAADAGRLIPLDELLRRTPQSFLEGGESHLLVYYAQVWALTHFLIEGEQQRYRKALQLALMDAAQGRLKHAGRGDDRGAEILSAYIDDDLADFERRYQTFVMAISQVGGASRIVQGRSPLE